jgi:hypothetical protein
MQGWVEWTAWFLDLGGAPQVERKMYDLSRLLQGLLRREQWERRMILMYWTIRVASCQL